MNMVAAASLVDRTLLTTAEVHQSKSAIVETDSTAGEGTTILVKEATTTTTIMTEAGYFMVVGVMVVVVATTKDLRTVPLMVALVNTPDTVNTPGDPRHASPRDSPPHIPRLDMTTPLIHRCRAGIFGDPKFLLHQEE